MKKKVIFSIVAVALFAIAMVFNSQGIDNALADDDDLVYCTESVSICESQYDEFISDVEENCDVAAFLITIWEDC